MNSFERNHDSVKVDNSWEEIKQKDDYFGQNENDSDNFIDDVDLQEDFTNDPSNQIPVISDEEFISENSKSDPDGESEEDSKSGSDGDLEEDSNRDSKGDSKEDNLKNFISKKREYEENMQDHREDEKKWKELELESLQDGYLNYYDTVRLILTDYEHVSANQAILTNFVYLLL